MVALAVTAGVSSGILRGGEAVSSMFFSTMLAVSPTFARVSCMSIVVASVASGHSAVFNEELIVFELPVVEQALLLENISFHWCPYL